MDVRASVFERNPIARQQCIDHYGCKCVVCDFDFEYVYGRIGASFIHVHHLKESLMKNALEILFAAIVLERVSISLCS